MDDFLDFVYSFAVKKKLSDLPKKDISDFKKNPSTKVVKALDFVLAPLIKFTIFLLIISFFIKVNIFIIAISMLIFFGFKKQINNIYIDLKSKAVKHISNIKILCNKTITEKVKLKLEGMAIILILMSFSSFKKLCISIFIILLLFTISDIYSNIKNRMKTI